MSARLRSMRPLRVLVGALLALYLAVSVYPFLWMLGGGFKSRQDVLGTASPLPADPTLDGVRAVWDQLDFVTLLLNSTLITAISIALILVVFPLAAYAFAVLEFPLRNALFLMFVGALLVPAVTVLLPIVILDRNLGLIDTKWGVILPLVNGAGPLAILILRAYFASIPRELRDAARMEGYGELAVFARVYFPLARPALITVAVLNCVGIWNEYVLPSVTLNERDSFTLPLGLQNLLSQNVVHWNEVLAAATIIVVPIIVLYAVLQRYVNAGLTGAVKG